MVRRVGSTKGILTNETQMIKNNDVKDNVWQRITDQLVIFQHPKISLEPAVVQFRLFLGEVRGSLSVKTRRWAGVLI